MPISGFFAEEVVLTGVLPNSAATLALALKLEVVELLVVVAGVTAVDVLFAPFVETVDAIFVVVCVEILAPLVILSWS